MYVHIIEEDPPNNKLAFRLSRAPCWREIFTKVRAERVMT